MQFIGKSPHTILLAVVQKAVWNHLNIESLTRDRVMVEYDKLYPKYGFAKHKGYGAKAHIEAIQKYGVSIKLLCFISTFLCIRLSIKFLFNCNYKDINVCLYLIFSGQIVAGNITDIRGSLVEIMLSNNQSVTARLTENFEYVIGQRAMFTVKSNDGKQIVLVPKDRTSMEQAGNLVLAKILG